MNVIQNLHEDVYKRWFRFVNFIPKRIRIVIATGVMTLVFLLSTFFSFGDTWWMFIFLIGAAAYLTAYLAIFEGIDKVEWYMLFIMPILFTLAAYLFYFLLPVRWLTRLPFVILFALVYYAILLTENIFNIGVEKSLQLYRAAFSVNYLLHVLVMLLLMQVVFSFKLHAFVNVFIVFIIALLLSIQLYWTVKPDAKFDKNLFLYCASTAILLSEVVTILSFVPFKTNVASLVVTTIYYSLTGILYHHFDGRLFRNVIREYLFVAFFVFFIAFLTLRW
ncbi:hypothetical protein A3A93_03620 [Candidatus Roizmanbacteria bacterium RIFCSPLOWO2_01_FULL_38_12]|uniref:Uncharacterized protein n=1 Tax=Candidatus Roizmanbacteria bacterium RIFCSPLOWO2_01_FULL_38_12 TaxID=1802061 RepID=A0A1F7IYT7_9BACT|nr:MAG: hypothetical protein A3F59_02205 [Candidatus Roizmanbacteria bacterium RIFCSPHIGHO2_12_FULL_38_13]OGK48524.1 MAG: hypothetical protein A3A93_03620 [Candidatus Roizmanbacteria bacterium RIFCSPLOWO2_01_FULL_38_12]